MGRGDYALVQHRAADLRRDSGPDRFANEATDAELRQFIGATQNATDKERQAAVTHAIETYGDK